MNNKTYNCYGEQKMGFKYYRQKVLDFNIYNNNKLSKEIKKFNDLCEKTQSFNKNENINLSLNNFSNFLKVINEEYYKDNYCINFYFGIFIKFVERVKKIYNSTLYDSPLSIDTNTIKFSYIIKSLYIKDNQIKYYNQIIHFINNENIEWDEEDRNMFKQYIKDNFEEKVKEQKEKSFSNYREKIINFKIDYKNDIYNQTKQFYYLCDDIQKINKDNGNLSLNNIYDVVNVMIDGYYFGLSINNMKIIKFYYNLIYQFIKRIQVLFIKTKTFTDINIDNSTVNFTIIIKKICENDKKIKYKNQILKFIENCKGLNGWAEKDKQELIEWINSFE